MNKQLGPGKLALIGLALIILTPQILGTTSLISTAFFAGGLFALVAAMIGGIKKLLNKSSTTGPDLDMTNPDSIENTVKIQLHCYSGYKAKYSKEEPTQLYIRVLSQRPGYNQEAIKAVLNQARSGSAHGKYNFQSVVTSMLLQEHMQDHGDIPDARVREIVDTVERLIPANA